MGVGVVAFAIFLGFLGARLEPATIALWVAAGALGLVLTALFRMVSLLARPATEVVLNQEAVLGGVADRELRDEKRRVLRAINELQFDYEMGKLSDEDHRKVREVYELRAIEVMRALDSAPGLHPKLQADLAEFGIGASPESKPEDVKSEAKPKAEAESGDQTDTPHTEAATASDDEVDADQDQAEAPQ